MNSTVADDRRYILQRIGTGAAIALTVLTFVPTPATAAKDCETGATNMAEVRSCGEREAEDALKRTYEDTLGYVRGKDPQAARLLVKAQKSWRQFLDDSCEYTVAARQTEMMSNDARYGCFIRFVDARINILKSYKRSFGKENICNGDPC